jgi:phosphatidylglycerol:prolipoprotein diacylglycerol transferase
MIALAYLVWDPNPAIVNVKLPLLDRPILWYGVLFALGFFVGYLVLTYLLRRYFLLSLEFRQEQVLSWPDFVQALKTQKFTTAKAVFSRLEPDTQQWCQNWQATHPIPEYIKIAILEGLNQAVNDPSGWQRPLSFLSKRLYAFAIRKNLGVNPAILKNRLQIEEDMTPILATAKFRTAKFAERLTFVVIIGAVVGARLGDVLFYQDWTQIIRHPLSIVAVWHGGLASHGGAIGILVALALFARKNKLPFWTVVDFTVIPTAIAAVFIRIGNFFNQEILGKPTSLPWGVIFLHPADGGPIVPRHPAQLYEAGCYLGIFAILMAYWQHHANFKPSGKLTGLFLLLVFGCRFLLEFLKVEQSVHVISSPLTMGQWLSLPFIALGGWLFWRK